MFCSDFHGRWMEIDVKNYTVMLFCMSGYLTHFNFEYNFNQNFIQFVRKRQKDENKEKKPEMAPFENIIPELLCRVWFFEA